MSFIFIIELFIRGYKMKIQPINSQTSFGVRYVNKDAWYPSAVMEFNCLSIVKQIKKKYPNAKFIFGGRGSGPIGNRSYYYYLSIFTDPQTVFSVSALNNSSYKALDSILSQLKYKKLEDIEKEMHCIQQSDSNGHKARCNRTADIKKFL